MNVRQEQRNHFVINMRCVTIFLFCSHLDANVKTVTLEVDLSVKKQVKSNLYSKKNYLDVDLDWSYFLFGVTFNKRSLTFLHKLFSTN